MVFMTGNTVSVPGAVFNAGAIFFEVNRHDISCLSGLFFLRVLLGLLDDSGSALGLFQHFQHIFLVVVGAPF